MDKRCATISRKTNETEVQLSLTIDGRGQYAIDTGIGFLDHMLTHLARHGLFDLEVRARGDTAVDAHHTVEDVAIALGRAFGEALGERRGIVRMADATVPMDEALATVAVDIGGRGHAVVQAGFAGPKVGQVDVDLIPHFIQTLAQEARMNIHCRVLYGANDHHKVEGLFKALARALDRATQLDPRLGGEVPSTKGTIGG
ncbi:MAG: imidazoleglycerol-phosphate dehydratase HisB [Chloroflexi bacterium]|nr:imidazoleglycerol-phosphate dehydratase HisB [Chloroflexota bacterium]